MNIVFLIRQMNEGGAQRQLYELARGLRDRGHTISVLTFYPGGRFEKLIEDEPGIHYHCLRKSGRFDTVPFLVRLLRKIRELRPDILHGYLTGANLFTVLLRPLLPSGARIVWGIRNSGVVELGADERLARLENFLARYAHLLIANSEAGRKYCLANGIPGDRVLVVHNGIDTERFHPDPQARTSTRAAWGISPDQFVVGIVGRLAANKGHRTFLEAAALFRSMRSGVRFVIVGSGPLESGLRADCSSLGLDEEVIWNGSAERTELVYPAFDLLVSASVVEGFANVIGEAMACGIPVTATDVGDSSVILGETGVIVPPRNPVALAQGMLAMSGRLGPSASSACRERITMLFDLKTLAERTERALRTITDPA